MTDKTAKQIENMRSTQFGMEIEMGNITREKAARKVAEFFGTDAWYAARQYGYDSWACKDDKGRVWKFERDVSIAGPDSNKCEMVTPILNYEDIEDLQQIIRILRKAHARSCPAISCGVHIHVSSEGHTPQTIRNLVNIMAAHETQIARAIKLDEHREARYCHTVDPGFLEALNKKKPKDMEELAEIWYTTQGGLQGRYNHYHPSRYAMLNLTPLFQGHENVEFRLFQFSNPHDGKRGGLHAGEAKTYIQLCLAMNELAKEVRTASPKKPQQSNDAFALRTWLCRLGFIGDEFKTAREILLRNMEGNSAWRYGRP